MTRPSTIVLIVLATLRTIADKLGFLQDGLCALKTFFVRVFLASQSRYRIKKKCAPIKFRKNTAWYRLK